jgi:hypothetical protein
MTRKRVSDEKTLSWHPYHTRLNFEFELVGGEMVEYMVQLEYNDGGYEEPDWRQVARSDTAHDYYHIDFHFENGKKVQRRESLPQNLTLDDENESAKDLFIRDEYKLLRRLGYV